MKNKLFGIECNFEELNGIDFKKGCYVGQENTARIKLKNKLSKRLLPIEIVEGKINEDRSIYYNNVEIGKVLINEEYPFALIRYSNENFRLELSWTRSTRPSTVPVYQFQHDRDMSHNK